MQDCYAVENEVKNMILGLNQVNGQSVLQEEYSSLIQELSNENFCTIIFEDLAASAQSNLYQFDLIAQQKCLNASNSIMSLGLSEVLMYYLREMENIIIQFEENVDSGQYQYFKD